LRQRDREIGIRVALGASSDSVSRLIFGEGLRLAAIGAAIGAAAVPVLLTACFAACYLPVRRATRIDPCSLRQAQ
jgi:putative ABC transport system permease protein